MKILARRSQRGFTLVELMVAITVALIVTAAVVAVLVSSKKAYMAQDKLARVQENGRFAMYYLMQDIRMSKYMGCLEEIVNVVRNNLNTTAANYYFGSVTGVNAEGNTPRVQSTDPIARPIEGIDNVVAGSTWSPSGIAILPAGFKPSVTASGYTTDMLTIRRAAPAAMARVAAPMAMETSAIELDTVDPFSRNQIVLIANCEAGDLFQISDIDVPNKLLKHETTGDANFSPGNRTAEVGKAYGNGDSATVFQFMTRTYFVANNPAGVPSLYQQENGATAVELVEGIESLQVLYGMSDGATKQPVRYLPAGHASLDWNRVVAVKIGLLARTSTEAYGDVSSMSYTVNGTTVGPFNDRNERRVFEATISLKSKVL